MLHYREHQRGEHENGDRSDKTRNGKMYFNYKLLSKRYPGPSSVGMASAIRD